MNRLLFAGATVLAVLLVSKASDAAAAPPGSPPAKGIKWAGPPNKAARAASHPKSYRNWTGYCWLPRYRCYGYFSPAYQGWFYWYPPLNRFLPIAYLATYPPAVTGVPFAPTGTTTPPPALPPGGTAIPNSTPPAPPADAAPPPPADGSPT